MLRAVGFWLCCWMVISGAPLASAQDVSSVPMTNRLPSLIHEEEVTVYEDADLRSILRDWGFPMRAIPVVARLTEPVLGSHVLPPWSRVYVMWGPSQGETEIPYRIVIHVPRESDGLLEHRVTVAITDDGNYVLGEPPPAGDFGPTPDGRTSRSRD